MSPAETELARRAKACPGFRWLPGMYDGDVRVLNRSDEMAPLIVISSEDGGVDWVSEKAMDLPDLDDLATLGCIEHGLLPDAWGMAFDREGWHDQHGVRHFRMCVHLEDGSCRDFDSRLSFADALVCALESAPRRPQPSPTRTARDS